MTPAESRSLRSGFLASHGRHPDRPALEVAGLTLSYDELYQRAASIAATAQSLTTPDDPPLIAVLAHRSTTAFAGILGTLLAGSGYVPLNPHFPTDRTLAMLQRSTCRTLIVGSEALDVLGALLPQMQVPLLVLLPDTDDVAALAAANPQHRFVTGVEFAPGSAWVQRPVDPNAVAYILFTSGSSGVPKGVQVAHRNINRFIDVMMAHYDIRETDRFSQMFELVFDLSLFDMFVSWQSGACLCCPSAGDAMLPAKYVIDSGITVWFSVPSLALTMKQMRALSPGLFPNLRISLFCGEGLLAEVAAAWDEAAPNSIVENLYGPTEVTLACTLHRWDPKTSPDLCDNGIVPIGEPFDGMTAMVADESFRQVPLGQPGELLMSGPQVALGYWNDQDKTDAAFITPPGKDAVHYRTGDLVRQDTVGGPIAYLGRIDHQIKIRGNRVELGEIESVLREAAGVDIAVAIGWPRTASGADGIVAFLGSETVDVARLRERVKARLPAYMAPKKYHLLAEVPLNANGKVDRKQLLARLERPS